MFRRSLLLPAAVLAALAVGCQDSDRHDHDHHDGHHMDHSQSAGPYRGIGSGGMGGVGTASSGGPSTRPSR